MREVICVGVGQCGIQCCTTLVHQLLIEHATAQYNGDDASALRYDDAMSSFFELTAAGRVCSRSVLIDMEDRPLTSLATSRLHNLFDEKLTVRDNSDDGGGGSGSGNNFARGHYYYGPRHAESISQCVRRALERCDSAETVLLMHSLGGGTGSGLGTSALQLIADEHAGIMRIVAPVIPSRTDDVVTSPYNAVCSSAAIAQFADAAIVFDNAALIRAINAYERGNALAPSTSRLSSAVPSSSPLASSSAAAFTDMNTLIGAVISDLTAGQRFHGEVNVDVNEITMNLIPRPQCRFIVPAIQPAQDILRHHHRTANIREHKFARTLVDADTQPLPPLRPTLLCARSGLTVGAVSTSDTSSAANIRNLLSAPSQLLEADHERATLLSVGVFARGRGASQSAVADVVATEISKRRVVGDVGAVTKVAVCAVATAANPVFECAALTNSTAVAERLATMSDDFTRMIRVKAHVHHFTEFMSEEELTNAHAAVADVIAAYRSIK